MAKDIITLFSRPGNIRGWTMHIRDLEQNWNGKEIICGGKEIVYW